MATVWAVPAGDVDPGFLDLDCAGYGLCRRGAASPGVQHIMLVQQQQLSCHCDTLCRGVGRKEVGYAKEGEGRVREREAFDPDQCCRLPALS